MCSDFRWGEEGGKEISYSPKRPVQLWGPLMFAFSGHWRYFARVKRPGRDVDHSSPSSADAKNEWMCASNPPRRGV